MIVGIVVIVIIIVAAAPTEVACSGWVFMMVMNVGDVDVVMMIIFMSVRGVFDRDGYLLSLSHQKVTQSQEVREQRAQDRNA